MANDTLTYSDTVGNNAESRVAEDWRSDERQRTERMRPTLESPVPSTGLRKSVMDAPVSERPVAATRRFSAATSEFSRLDITAGFAAAVMMIGPLAAAAWGRYFG